MSITKKQYQLSGNNFNLDKFKEDLKYNNIRFTVKSRSSLPDGNVIPVSSMTISLNISDDMITEVEELINDTAKKYSVKFV